MQQGWGSNSGNGNETWGGDGSRPGASNHWGEPQKGAGSVGWDSDSDRSGSGCWSEPGRTNTSSSNTWVSSGGSNTPDQSTPNPGSNWGDTVNKPSPQSNNQGWGESMKNNHGSQNWGESNSKPCNEWGKGPESNMSRGNPSSNKPTGTYLAIIVLLVLLPFNEFLNLLTLKSNAILLFTFQAGWGGPCL